jgi:hypothetical protein
MQGLFAAFSSLRRRLPVVHQVTMIVFFASS